MGMHYLMALPVTVELPVMSPVASSLHFAHETYC